MTLASFSSTPSPVPQLGLTFTVILLLNVIKVYTVSSENLIAFTITVRVLDPAA